MPTNEPSAAKRDFATMPEAFDYCRMQDRPVRVIVAGAEWKLYPSGRAEQLTVAQAQRVSKYDIATRLALAGLDGYTGRLAAKQQRELFGRVIYGKMTVTIDCNNQGRIYGRYKVCFGTDTVSWEHDFERVARYCNEPASAPSF